MDDLLKILRKNTILEKIILCDGQPGNGKSMFGALIAIQVTSSRIAVGETITPSNLTVKRKGSNLVISKLGLSSVCSLILIAAPFIFTRMETI